MIETNFFRTLEKVSSFLLLNLLWLIVCLPLFTFFPATAAMFTVVRNWQTQDDYQFFHIFWRSFLNNFKPNFVLGLAWLGVGSVIIINYRSIPSIPVLFQFIFYTVNTFVALVFSAITVFVFPLFAHYEISPRLAVKLAFVLSLQQLRITGLCLLATLLVVALAFMIPLTLLVTGSILAYVVFSLCSRKFPEDPAFPVQS
jgi:uncharacterized membrane protein YesL